MSGISPNMPEIRTYDPKQTLAHAVMWAREVCEKFEAIYQACEKMEGLVPVGPESPLRLEGRTLTGGHVSVLICGVQIEAVQIEPTYTLVLSRELPKRIVRMLSRSPLPPERE
jgi:hypothetical protein